MLCFTLDFAPEQIEHSWEVRYDEHISVPGFDNKR